MKIEKRHEWNLTTEQAAKVQNDLRGEVVTIDDLPSEINFVAGVDLGYDEENQTCRAVVAVLSFPDLRVVETSEAVLPIQFPYVPGFLSFREIPVAIVALENLKIAPDLILCDGQGLAHPRRFGIACHLGVLANVPTIGAAKSILIGRHDELGETRGSQKPLVHKNEIVGVALRTRDNTRPMYISVGHKISLETAVDYVLRCAPKYRLPETTRVADRLASYRKR
ncbi:MAG: deoxyribonuclease V [Pyrinomonadaceae bacterium]|nr:deoxyribonuclease V [Pyrinomonadaceae bacterium]